MKKNPALNGNKNSHIKIQGPPPTPTVLDRTDCNAKVIMSLYQILVFEYDFVEYFSEIHAAFEV